MECKPTSLAGTIGYREVPKHESAQAFLPGTETDGGFLDGVRNFVTKQFDDITLSALMAIDSTDCAMESFLVSLGPSKHGKPMLHIVSFHSDQYKAATAEDRARFRSALCSLLRKQRASRAAVARERRGAMSAEAMLRRQMQLTIHVVTADESTCWEVTCDTDQKVSQSATQTEITDEEDAVLAALEHFERPRCLPAAPSAEQIAESECWHAEGNVHFKQRRFDGAVPCYKYAAGCIGVPGNARCREALASVLSNRSTALLKLGQTDEP